MVKRIDESKLTPEELAKLEKKRESKREASRRFLAKKKALELGVSLDPNEQLESFSSATNPEDLRFYKKTDYYTLDAKVNRLGSHFEIVADYKPVSGSKKIVRSVIKEDFDQTARVFEKFVKSFK
jgi:hypothetical protein